MRTQMLGHLDIDRARVAEDLAVSATLPLAEQYTEFSCGRPWKSCMLWSCGGEVGDGILTHYDTSQRARPTVHGERLPYLSEAIEKYFAVEHLLFARMAIMTDNVLVPHRDFVEFTGTPAADRVTHRLHLPLQTTPDGFFMEDDVVYRMRFGEVWFLDVTRMHSAAVLSDAQRIHLILDFAGTAEGNGLLRFESTTEPGIPAANRVDRPALTQRERDAVPAMAGFLDEENLTEVFGLLTKKHFRRDGGPNFVWDAVADLAKRNGDPALQARVDELFKHYVIERDE